MRISRYWWIAVLLFVVIGLWYITKQPILFSPSNAIYSAECNVKEDCYNAYGSLPECTDYSCRQGQCIAIIEDACAPFPGDPISISCINAVDSQRKDETCGTLDKRIGEQGKDYFCRVITCETDSALNAGSVCCAGNGQADVQICETLQRVADANKVLKIKACQ